MLIKSWQEALQRLQWLKCDYAPVEMSNNIKLPNPTKSGFWRGVELRFVYAALKIKLVTYPQQSDDLCWRTNCWWCGSYYGSRCIKCNGWGFRLQDQALDQGKQRNCYQLTTYWNNYGSYWSRCGELDILVAVHLWLLHPSSTGISAVVECGIYLKCLLRSIKLKLKFICLSNYRFLFH